MHSFAYTFLFIAVCTFFPDGLAAQSSDKANTNAGDKVTGASAANSTVATPIIVAMKCEQAFLPISEADLYAMNLTDPSQSIPSNLSTVPTQAACKNFDDSKDGFCDPNSCVGFPVAEQCNEVSVTGENSTTVSNVTIAKVSCQGNYFKPAANETEKITLCTDKDQRSYKCKGNAIGEAECTKCFSMSDPAFTSS